MKTVGIVAEYNPFHNGHLYQIQKVKEHLSPDFIVVVMSSNFSQRGEPTCLSQLERTRLALLSGASLVIELPTVFSSASAEHFATAAIKSLHALGIIDHIVFGAECDDLKKLENLANYLVKESREYKKSLKEELKTGSSFPVARANALKSAGLDSDLFLGSNNILAIEYLKALKRLNSTIAPYVLKRVGPGFNSDEISETFSSATHIRKKIAEDYFQAIQSFVPDYTYKALTQNPLNFLDTYSDILFYRLRTMNREELRKIHEIKEGIENRILERAPDCKTISELLERLKCKRYPYSSLSRMVLNILLNITTKDFKAFEKGFPRYIRVLGFRKQDEQIWKALKTNAKASLVTNLGDFLKDCKKESRRLLQKEMIYSNLYHLKTDRLMNAELTQKLMVL